MKALIALAVVAGIGGGAWYWTNEKAPAAPASSESAELSTDVEASGSATFGELAARGGSSECQVSAVHEAASSSGTAYIANGKVRVDFVGKAGGMSITGHVIQADGYAYTWTDLMPQGVKVSIDAAPAAAASQGFDSSTKVEYSCKEWAVDESKFAPPASITFTEFNANAQGGASMPLPR